MMLKVRNHERIIRAISLDYGVEICMTHGDTMDAMVLKNRYSRKNVTVQVPKNYNFYQSLTMIYKVKSEQITQVFGRDYTILIGTIVAGLQSLYSYEEPLFFTVELYK